MGGFGSGRTDKVGRRPRKKLFVSQLPCLNSFKCMNTRLIKENKYTVVTFEWTRLVIKKDCLSIYHKDAPSEGKPLFFSPMQVVKCGFGERYYFSCPYCCLRTSRLYYLGYFACRQCHCLAYRSQNMSNEDRWLMKRDRLLQRYGATFEEASYSSKPKGKHKKTFERVVEEFQFLTDYGIHIFFNRFEYPNILDKLRYGKKAGFEKAREQMFSKQMSVMQRLNSALSQRGQFDFSVSDKQLQ